MKVSNLKPLYWPDDSRIAIIGEAPGGAEEELGEPFVTCDTGNKKGAAGRELHRWMTANNIIRSQVFIGNICQYRPPNNKLELFFQDTKCTIPKEEVKESLEILKEELSLYQPNVIVALGRHALYHLTGKQGIFNWWGSVLPCTLVPGLKVVPIPHPSNVIRGLWRLRPICSTLLGKAKRQSFSKELILPQKNLLTGLSYSDTMDYLDFLQKQPAVSFDIETIPRDNVITCLGLAASSQEAICIPFIDGTKVHWNENQEIAILRKCSSLLGTSGQLKIAHNIMYDMTYLALKFRIYVAPPFYDTMVAHNRLYPDFSNKTLQKMKMGRLAVCTTLYTNNQYYKDDRKAENEADHWKGALQTFWEYNAKDAAVTYEVYEVTKNLLKQQNKISFLESDMQNVIPLMRMSLRGFKRNLNEIAALSSECAQILSQLDSEINEAAGYPINAGSSQQVAKLLYVDRNHKPQFSKTGRITADETALAKLRNSGDPIITFIINRRRIAKFKSTYIDTPLYNDRFRTMYNQGRTTTQRLSSSKFVFGDGGNGQNIPSRPRPKDDLYNKLLKRLKNTFEADDGKLLAKRDYCQAEALVVAYLANDITQIQDFQNNIDIHCRTAEILYDIPYQKIKDEVDNGNPEYKMKRYFAKKCRHAFNYKMGPRRLKDEFLKEFINVEEKECRKLIESMKIGLPFVVQWQNETADFIKRNRRISNCFGFTLFFFGLIDDESIREGLAFGPQSTVGEMGKIAARNVANAGIDILMTIHDAIIYQEEEDKIIETSEKVNQLMIIPLIINNKELIIPTDLAIGKTWGQMKEIKK